MLLLLVVVLVVVVSFRHCSLNSEPSLFLVSMYLYSFTYDIYLLFTDHRQITISSILASIYLFDPIPKVGTQPV